ncbi:TPA: PTS sugar transporter subunit IIB [Escherichia coli]|uniref:PTS sugar transporter subunit IIB n=1 Tax=Escherichia coli TaxID=562 RepID=UPI001FB2E0B1|nr:hypothetical protein [Escherichia coli]
MKKILLVCAAGMSTSMLVKRMIDHATAISLEVNISALAIAEAKGKIKNNEVDVVLLGPQCCSGERWIRFYVSNYHGKLINYIN